MRRFTIGLAIVLALSLMLAAVAIAAPPGYCGPNGSNQDHPSCPTTPSPDPDPPDLQPCPESFPLSGSGWSDFECDWTPANTGTMGIITVNVVGEVSLLNVVVRDSKPGDYCELSWEGKTDGDSEWYSGSPTGDLELTFPLVAGDDSYWDSGTNWCGPRTDLNGEPLHLWVGFRGKKTVSVTVTMDPLEATP